MTTSRVPPAFVTQIGNIPLEDRVFAPMFAYRIAIDADRPFVRTDGRDYSYGEFGKLVLDFARGLKGRDVGRGDMVTIMLPNCLEYIVAWFAVHLRGACAAFVNPQLRGAELASILDDCKSRAVVVSPDLIAAVETKAVFGDFTTSIVVVNSTGAIDRRDPRVVAFSALLEGGGEDPVEQMSFTDVQTVMFTSGSTGRPKGIMIPNGHYFGNPSTFIRLTAMTRDDVLHTSLPLFHSFSARQGVLPAFMVGAKVDLASKFSASRFWPMIEESGATLALMTSSMPQAVMTQPPSPRDRKHRLRALYNVPYDPRFEDRYGVKLLSTFATTEVGCVTSSRFDDWRPGTVGRSHEDWDISLVDDDGMPVADGQPGEALCRPKRPFIMMQGYLNQPEATVKSWQDLWYHTGDILSRDAEGYYYFLDRGVDRIRRNGETISAGDLERQLCTHPFIRDCIAVSCPGPLRGEDDIRIIALPQVGVEAPSKEEFSAWLQQKLPRFLIPRFVEIVDSFPQTTTGKVDRKAIRASAIATTAWELTS